MSNLPEESVSSDEKSMENQSMAQSGATTAPDAQLPLIVKGKAPANLQKAEPSLLRWLLLKIRFIPLVMLLVATSGVVALFFQPPGLQMLMGILGLEPSGGTSTPIAVPVKKRQGLDASAGVNKPATRRIVGLGKLLPEGDVRTVAPPFGAGDARIAKLHLKEGDKVSAGDRLATLDNEQGLMALVKNAESTVSVREAALNQVKNSVLASLEETQASLQRARGTLQNAQSEYDRAETLFKRGYTARSAFDQKLSARDQARGEVERLTATLARFTANSIDEQHDVIVAARNLDSAKSELNRVKSDLNKASVRAPITGTVLSIHVRPGEKPGSKGILNLGDIDHMIAEVEIYQTDIGSISLGLPASVTAEAFKQKLKGSVTKIGLEVGRQTLVDPSPAANTDARVVIVTVTLDEQSSRIAQRFTNLQVLAQFEVGGL